MAKFYSAPMQMSMGGNDDVQGVAMRFIDKPIPKEIFARFKRACENHISFGEINAADLLALMREARLPLPVHDSEGDDGRRGIDIQQAQSIRRHVVRQYNISNAYRIEQEMPAIARDYAAGKELIEISEALKLSPFIIFRKLMEHLHGPSFREKLNLLSLGKTRASDILSERDAEQYEVVRAFDFESVSVQLKMAEIADRREANFIAFLRGDLGITLKTQTELYAEQTREGRQPITPDALFLSPVEINGQRAYWVDFKSYCGTSIPFLARSTSAQAAKYETKFGPGFMVYEHGFVGSLPYRAVSARSLRDIIDNGVVQGVLI